MLNTRLCLGLVLAVAWVSGRTMAGENDPPTKRPAKTATKPDAAKSPTHKVEKGPFNVEVSLKGVFEAENTKEISLVAKDWPGEMHGAALVRKVVEHGTPVHNGDTLAEFDTTKIDQAIKDLKAERELAEIAIRQAETELPILERSAPVELAEAERNHKRADEDLKRFLEIDRPLAVETAEHEVKSAVHRLESAREELHQLQKMYRDKDLTEETEQFILKRQRFQVEMAEFGLKAARIERDRVVQTDLPRREVNAREQVTKQQIALDKARGLTLGVTQRRLALAKLKYDQTRASERLQNLESDRNAMTVRAPADGILYHGRCSHGQWSTSSARLQIGSTVFPDHVFMTVVNPRPLFVRATVEEKDLYKLRPEQTGKVTPSGYPDLKLAGQVTAVAAVPHAAGTFDAHVRVELGDAVVMPGMACTLKFTGYHKSDALTVPSSAVFTEDDDEDARYVYLVGKSGKHEKKTVKVGRTSGSKIEILEGLQEGDEILAAKPKE